MRKNWLALVLLIGWALTSQVPAQTQAFTDREVAGLMGPVKIVRERVVDYSLVNKNFIESSTRETVSMRFNEAGYKPGSIPGVINSETIHNATENKTVYTEYTSAGSIIRRQVYQYDSRNDLTEIVYYNNSNQMTEKDTFQYNDKHQLILMNSYIRNELLIGQSRYEYNQEGKMTSQFNINSDGEVLKKHFYDYTAGKISQYTITDPSDQVYRLQRYETDNTGSRTITLEEYPLDPYSLEKKASPISPHIFGDVFVSHFIYSATHTKISSDESSYNFFIAYESGKPVQKRNQIAALAYDNQDRILEEQYFDPRTFALSKLYTHIYTDRLHTIHDGKRRDGTLPAPSWVWEFNENGLLIHYKTLSEEAYIAYDEHENPVSRSEPIIPSRDVTWEYQYDFYGNWVRIEEKRFSHDNVQGKRVFLRDIEYYNTTPVEDYGMHEPVKTER